MGALFIDGVEQPDPFRDWPARPIGDGQRAHTAARAARFEDAMETALREIAETVPPIIRQAMINRQARAVRERAERQAVAA